MIAWHLKFFNKIACNSVSRYVAGERVNYNGRAQTKYLYRDLSQRQDQNTGLQTLKLIHEPFACYKACRAQNRTSVLNLSVPLSQSFADISVLHVTQSSRLTYQHQARFHVASRVCRPAETLPSAPHQSIAIVSTKLSPLPPIVHKPWTF